MAAFKVMLGFLVIGAASAETGLAEGAAESKQNVTTDKAGWHGDGMACEHEAWQGKATN